MTTTSAPDSALVAAVRAALAGAGDPERAAGQQRYMKSAMPYRGLTSPELRALLRPLLADAALAPASRRGVGGRRPRALGRRGTTARSATPRSPSPATGRPGRGRTPTPSMLYRHLVVTGAWWDFVDVVAADRVGPILLRHRPSRDALLARGAVDDDLWVRRTAIIASSAPRGDRPRAADRRHRGQHRGRAGRDFFIRKAIGWALRHHARIDPDWVRAFVAATPTVSGLSRREALKHLGRRGRGHPDTGRARRGPCDP